MLDYAFSVADPDAWVRHHLTGATLGDPRRRSRAIAIAAAMARQPGAMIPQMFDRTYDIKAAYTFYGRPEVTPDTLHAGHREQVHQELHRSGTTALLIEDSSHLIWRTDEPIDGLGPIGRGRRNEQGFLLHSALAVRWPEVPAGAVERPPVEVLGLAHQQYHVRTPRPAGEPVGHDRARKQRALESDIWVRTGEHLGPAPADVRLVRVADRGADIYEYLIACGERGHGFVVRASQSRRVDHADGTKAGTLFPILRAVAPMGSFALYVRRRGRHPARTAQLSVAACRVRLSSPQRPGHGAGTLPPVDCTAVRVWEAHPPAGIKRPLEWILLTDAPVERPEQAVEVALQYSTRWLIEEFHKGLKTGLGAEVLQLETAHRLFAAIALMSLVALRLIDLREHVRCEPDAPATAAGLSPLELHVLHAYRGRTLATVRDVALAIGRLGGHMGRRSDGMPGWITLWRGMKKLEWLVQGVILAKKVETFGV